jgi:hypothetical protein
MFLLTFRVIPGAANVRERADEAISGGTAPLRSRLDGRAVQAFSDRRKSHASHSRFNKMHT